MFHPSSTLHIVNIGDTGTLHETQLDRDCIVIQFRPTYCVGDTAYRITRPKFENGSRKTLATFAYCVPVFWCDGKWAVSPAVRPIIVEWSRECTLLDIVE